MIDIKKSIVCIELLAEKGTEELLPERFYALCNGVGIEEQNEKTLLRCYPHQPEAFLEFVRGSGLPVVIMSVTQKDEEDYGALVKKYFKSFTIEGVAILPPWEKISAGKPHIVIDPGMAFGTGRHELTKLMMKCVKGLPITRKSVLDLGCGSAILSLYARLQDSTHVIGVDIDPDAVFSAAKNLKLNRTRNVYLACADLALLRGTFDVVLANLDIQTFQRSLRHILQRIAPGGHLVVSGIESTHKNAFLALLKPLTPIVTRRMGSWYAFVFRVD